MCETLQLLGYDRFALMIEGWVVMGEGNLKDIKRWVGRMVEHPKAKTSIQIIFVGPGETFGKFAVYDETEAGWVLVREVESTPEMGQNIEKLQGDTQVLLKAMTPASAAQ